MGDHPSYDIANYFETGRQQRINNFVSSTFVNYREKWSLICIITDLAAFTRQSK
jgi:hypothetical protein